MTFFLCPILFLVRVFQTSILLLGMVNDTRLYFIEQYRRVVSMLEAYLLRHLNMFFRALIRHFFTYVKITLMNLQV